MKGILLEKKGNNGIILTEKGAFLKGKCPKNSAIGEEIIIKQNGNLVKYAIAAMLIFSLSFSSVSIIGLGQLYGYAEIDINPSVEIGYNKKLEVIQIRGLNEDGKSLLNNIDVQIKGMKIDDAIVEIVEFAEILEYNTKEFVVTYTNSGREKDIEINNLLQEKLERVVRNNHLLIEVSKNTYREERKTSQQPAKEIIKSKIEEYGGELKKELKEYNVSELANIMNEEKIRRKLKGSANDINSKRGEKSQVSDNDEQKTDIYSNKKAETNILENKFFRPGSYYRVRKHILDEINEKIIKDVDSGINDIDRVGEGQQHQDDDKITDDNEPRPGAGQQYQDDDKIIDNSEPRPGAGQQYQDEEKITNDINSDMQRDRTVRKKSR